jgi:hypothetical protein
MWTHMWKSDQVESDIGWYTKVRRTSMIVSAWLHAYDIANFYQEFKTIKQRLIIDKFAQYN